MKTITIAKNDAGQRLDKFLTKAFPHLPQSMLYKSIRTKRIQRNGKRCAISDRLAEGDVLELYLYDEFLTPAEVRYPFMQASRRLDVAYEDDQLLAFYDIDPQAPTHFLVIPKQHIDSAAALTESDAALLGHIYAVIADLCRQLGVAENGYRVVTNVGADGGQSVKHLHFHVLAGRSLAWPPG